MLQVILFSTYLNALKIVVFCITQKRFFHFSKAHQWLGAVLAGCWGFKHQLVLLYSLENFSTTWMNAQLVYYAQLTPKGFCRCLAFKTLSRTTLSSWQPLYPLIPNWFSVTVASVRTWADIWTCSEFTSAAFQAIHWLGSCATRHWGKSTMPAVSQLLILNLL